MFMLEIVVSLADRIANYQGKLMQFTKKTVNTESSLPLK